MEEKENKRRVELTAFFRLLLAVQPGCRAAYNQPRKEEGQLNSPIHAQSAFSFIHLSINSPVRKRELMEMKS